MSIESPNPPSVEKNKKPKRTLTHRAASAILKGMYTVSAISQYGLRDGIELIQSGEDIAGLIEGAMIAPKIAYVDHESGQLIYKEASKGGLIAFDAARSKEFPAIAHNFDQDLISEGVIWSMLPAELKDNPASQRTRVGDVNIFDIETFMTLDKRSIQELIGENVLRVVSMAEAFDTVGLSDHIPGLEARRIATDKVYQVTPKGSTLTRLEDDDGDTTPKLEPRFKAIQVPGLLAHG